jgi:hypothetical protein
MKPPRNDALEKGRVMGINQVEYLRQQWDAALPDDAFGDEAAGADFDKFGRINREATQIVTGLDYGGWPDSSE